jgi:hypothetical protein
LVSEDVVWIKFKYNYRCWQIFTLMSNTVKPVLRGHLWDKEKVAL